MASAELFRFRTVRPIQHKEAGFRTLTVAPKSDQLNQDLLNQLAAGITAFLGSNAWLEPLSEKLAAASDDVSPAALVTFLPTDWTTQVAAWPAHPTNLVEVLGSLAGQVRGIMPLAGNYGIPVIPGPTTQNIELICRLILVQDCLTTLAADQALPAPTRTFQSADDIRVALSFRAVALPKSSFGAAKSVIARSPGVTDLSVVRDEWNRYIAGELANVVNVLPGELFDSRVDHIEETVQTTSTVDQKTTSQTTEVSQTKSTTLAQTTTNDASSNIGVSGQVNVSGTYGPTTVSTSVGGQAQFAKSSAQSTAMTTAVETVARAVKTVSETITQSQSIRTSTKDISHEEHKVQNGGSTTIVGLYRWLSVVHRVQLVNYPNRFVVEFEIPEPGAWLRWALSNQPDKALSQDT